MFETLLEQRLAIYAMLHGETIAKPNDVRVLDMEEEQWSFMEAIVPVLKPLYTATRVMYSEESHRSVVFSIASGAVSNLRAVLDSDTVVKLVFLNNIIKSVFVQPPVDEKGSVSVKVEPQFSVVVPQSSVVISEPNLPSLPNLPTLG